VNIHSKSSRDPLKMANASLWVTNPMLKTIVVYGSILFKFLLETRLESESFEPLIDFLACLVQKFWPKNNKFSNYIIILLFLSHNYGNQKSITSKFVCLF